MRAGMLHRLGDPPLGDLVEEDPVDLGVAALDLPGDVPGDRLPFTVRVGGDVDGAGVRGLVPQPRDDLVLALDGLVLRNEAAVDVDPDLALREVLDVADGGLDMILFAEVLVDGLRLGGGLDDDQRLSRRRFRGVRLFLRALRRGRLRVRSWSSACFFLCASSLASVDGILVVQHRLACCRPACRSWENRTAATISRTSSTDRPSYPVIIARSMTFPCPGPPRSPSSRAESGTPGLGGHHPFFGLVEHSPGACAARHRRDRLRTVRRDVIVQPAERRADLRGGVSPVLQFQHVDLRKLLVPLHFRHQEDKELNYSFFHGRPVRVRVITRERLIFPPSHSPGFESCGRHSPGGAARRGSPAGPLRVPG